MGRTLATIVAALALVVGLALLDHSREREPAADQLAGRIADAQESGDVAAAEGGSFAGGSLSDCLGSLAAEPPAGGDFPGLDERGVEEISQRVERIRHLRFSAPVDATFLGDAALDRRIEALAGTEGARELAARQGAALELLGAIPDGNDLYELTTRALAAQVVGLYVPETKELLVATAGKPGAVEEITLAHELEHALADDDLGLPLSSKVVAGEGDSDLAAQSLVEGDATLTMELYALRYVDLSDQLGLGDDPELAGGGLGKLPDFLRRQLLFPYEAGLQYVCDRYEQGGWRAVDDAYSDPPASTAELLGLRDTDPVAAPPAGRLARPWRPVLRDQLGAAALAWIFAAPGGDPDGALPDPREPISGWAGDRLTLWQRPGGESALSLSIVDEGGSLCGAMIAWYAAANPDAELSRAGDATTFSDPDGGRAAVVACSGESVVVGIGPDEGTAAKLAAEER